MSANPEQMGIFENANFDSVDLSGTQDSASNKEMPVLLACFSKTSNGLSRGLSSTLF